MERKTSAMLNTISIHRVYNASLHTLVEGMKLVMLNTLPTRDVNLPRKTHQNHQI